MDKKARSNTINNKTKCRLRKALHERKTMQKVQINNPTATLHEFCSESQRTQNNTPHVRMDNIDRVVKFIEGDENKEIDLMKDKKKAKKARQKEKREQEKVKLQQEKDEMEKMKELMRLKTEQLAAELQETLRISKNKSKHKNQGKLIEENIQAIITVKRFENLGYSNPQSVTLTLKKSSKAHENLLLSYVNGKSKVNPQSQTTYESKKMKKKKTHEQKNDVLADRIIELEVKEKLKNDPTSSAASSSLFSVVNSEQRCCYSPSLHPPVEAPSKKKAKHVMTDPFSNTISNYEKPKENELLNIATLRLPPGITITKVEGPVNDKLSKPAVPKTQNPSNPTVIKNGITSSVISTDRITQQHINCMPPMNFIPQSGVNFSPQQHMNCVPNSTTDSTEGKKSRKKKKSKKNQEAADVGSSNDNQGQSIVTLKNPLFNKQKVEEKIPDLSQYPAAIFKNENGMVTIRSSRLQQSINDGEPIPSFLTDLKPVIGPDISTPQATLDGFPENGRTSPFNPEEVLSGLPSIEITKVDKCSARLQNDSKKCQQADVSIIPTNNPERCAEDWHYDKVFSPKDFLEDDMDAEERELENFKRFCQESVPPKCKEKVAHLNVKDIVLRKKSDENSL